MVYPWSDFYKIKRGGGGHRSVPSRQISPLSLLKCGLTAPEIAKIGNFGYKFAQNGYTPLSDFTKFGLRERVPVSHPRAKFHHCEFKNMGLQPPKSLKLVFLVYICPKGVYPLRDFFYTKFGLLEGVSGQHRHTKFHRSGLQNVGLQPQNSRKIAIFGINFPLWKTFGVHRKSWV